jgi:hypothetical protein
MAIGNRNNGVQMVASADAGDEATRVMKDGMTRETKKSRHKVGVLST